MYRGLKPDYWCTDNDHGTFFLNFPLHPELQKYCGIDMTQLYDVIISNEEYFGLWIRNAMRLKPSLYASIQGASQLQLAYWKNRKNVQNPLD